MTYTQPLLNVLSVLTIVGLIIAVLIIASFMRQSSTSAKTLFRWISTHGLILMLVTATIATTGSLYFSEIALWTPCALCWYQRIFMYPQVALLALALWKKDRRIAPYIFALSIIGLCIAVLHYGEQVSAALYPAVIDPNVPCDTSGTSCRSTPFFRFGFITIPTMAFTVFLLNALGSLVMMKTRTPHGNIKADSRLT